MESLKATTYHIKQVADDPQATQINLLMHQCTELPAGKYEKTKSSVKSRQSNHKNLGSKNSQVQRQHKKWFEIRNACQNKERCSKCGDSIHVEGFQCPAKSSSIKLVTNLDTLLAFVFRKKQAPFKSRKPKAHQLQAGSVYAKESTICGQSEDYSSSEDSFCLHIKVQHTQASLQKIPKPAHLITNLAYRLNLHHTRNLFLRTRLNTCADVNVMPASMHKLVFKDPEMKKLASSS